MKRGRRIARWLGLDGNSLRRRTDKVGAYGKATLLAVFLIGTPVACTVAGIWTYHTAMTEQRVQRSWHQVPAIVLESVPEQDNYYGNGVAWTPASWTAAGHRHKGEIPVNGGAKAGTRVPVWVNASGQSSGPPLSRDSTLIQVVDTVVLTPLVLAAALLLLAATGRYLLNRRRMAGWEASWASVGPQWTRQFWAPGK
jgi:uncharacterized membrane protein YidH (DUF202 family)